MKAGRLPAHRPSRWWPLLLAWPAIALAHAGGCSITQAEMNVYYALTFVAALAFVGVLAWGLFAIRGRWWWRVLSNLIQAALFAGLVLTFFFMNLGFQMGCSGGTSSLYAMIAFNFLPALVLLGTLLLFRKIGRRMA